MASPDSAAQIVARFLRANHYNDTLEAFIREAGLPEDAGTSQPGAWTIEQILQEKTQFDTSVRFERHGAAVKQGWTSPAPSHAQEPSIEIKSNVLCVTGDVHANEISATTADRSWNRFSGSSPYGGVDDVFSLGDSPVLSIAPVSNELVLTTSMSGHLALRTKRKLALIDSCRHHIKYAVQVVSFLDGEDWFVATAGWDRKVYIYAPKVVSQSVLEGTSDSDHSQLPGYLGEPIHAISLTSNPESLAFARHPDTSAVYLLVSRRDSTHLCYYRIEREVTGKVLVHEAGQQNLAPHSNAWVAFTPCSLALCPTDPSLMAVATSHLPHMKLIIFRLLFPEGQTGTNSAPQTVAALARTELALQNREDAAIRIQITTMAPQTPYSTPQVVWRPDGSGLFVNGDDGVIRGIEASSGKVVCFLKGHEPGSKVRTLWAGALQDEPDGHDREVLVSGGFDKKVLIWTIEDTS